jgi:hypothetical protein
MRDFVGGRECVTHHACGCIQARLDLADAEVKRLRQGIWDMATVCGMDTDGDTTPDHMVYPDIVELGLQEVRELRSAYDEACAELQADPNTFKVLGLGEDNKP